MNRLLCFPTVVLALALAGGCSSSSDSAEDTTPTNTGAGTGGTLAAPRGPAVGTAKVIVTNGGTTPLYFFTESLEVGEPYIQTRAVGSPVCGGQAFERRPTVVTPVAAGATYQATFAGIATNLDSAQQCWSFDYVAAGAHPGRVCAYEEQAQVPTYSALQRPSADNLPKPTRCVDFTITMPPAGQESVTNVTLPPK
jgi:hypothetical protein